MRVNEVSSLETAQRQKAAQTLARAFHHDPMYQMVLPDEEKRAGFLTWIFDRLLLYCFKHGQMLALQNFDGAALWLPPGKTKMTLFNMVRVGLYATPFKLGWKAYRLFDAYLSYAGALHKQHAPKSHWYLLAIGVGPSSQGKGFGRAILQPMLEKIDAENIACYLETGIESNIGFYESHGFKVVCQGILPGYKLDVWGMLRNHAAE
jgi:ribosomal protein S18 acetylase RimI-like enzyme